MISAESVAEFHLRCVESDSWPDNQSFEYEQGLWSVIERNHRFNGLLWAQEDQARRTDVSDGAIVANKRAIDGFNQSRNNMIEQMDECILSSLPPVEQCQDAWLNTETAGSVIDRLSILSLKIHHFSAQTRREDVDESHRLSVNQKLRQLREQKEDLMASFDSLLAACASGRAYYKIYRQHKMYNDPKLNPYLSGRKS